MNIENVVKVDINLAKSLVSQKNFGRGMILGTTQRFAERFRIYSSLDDVAVDFQVTDPEYLAAKRYFAPGVAPADLMIGRGDVEVGQSEHVTETALAAAIYTITINGHVYSLDYTGGAPADSTTLFTAFKALLDAGTDPIVSTLDGVAPNEDLTINANDLSVQFTLAVGANLDTTPLAIYVGADSNLDAITAVSGGQDWYGLINPSRLKSDILATAAWIETSSGRYIYIGVTVDADVLTNVTDDVASMVKTAGYTRTDIFYSTDYASYPEAAWFGLMLPKDPGSATFALKTLPGIVSDTLVENEVNNLISKFASYYVNIGGVDVTQGSKTGDGDFLDIQVGIDWLRATMEQAIYALLTSVDKVPFTDGGIQMIGNVITSVLKSAVDPQNVLASFTTSFPSASSFSPTDRETRVLSKLKFGGVLAGAVHKVNVVGNVTF